MQEKKFDEAMTPAMIQYYDMKKDYKDSILFFRMGDFYEMFDEDAHIANKILGIAITSRNKNSKFPTPLAGIPFHAKDKYLPQLIEAGYKVAIAEQVSDPKLKGIVKREVVRVVTPSTIGLEGEGYETNNSNIISISYKGNSYGLSALNFGQNKWQACEFNNFGDLQGELFKLFPKEVILEKNLFNNEELQSILEKKYSLNIYYFEPKEDAYSKLTSHFKTNNLNAFGIEDLPEAQRSSSLLLEYLESNQKTNFLFLNSLSLLDFKDHMKLDEATIRNLDLVYNIATKSNKDGTLLGVLNQTKTSSGNIMLYDSIIKPLKNKEEIEKRLQFVEEFYNDKILLDNVRYKLSSISNINLIMNRIALNRTSPRDLINLKNSLKSILEIIDIIDKSGNKILKKLIN